ncbi:hypothetical protein ACFVHW_07775 [Streptomyces sp. NPDC127110]|uniref:DUF6197 family protein n=1 Tax=Streptomyces sp. NPDC127110 TaxID=3345362 RepID=UPI00362EBD48
MVNKSVNVAAPSDGSVVPPGAVPLDVAGQLTAEDWIDWSGELVLGETVALHLEAAAVLLERDGWWVRLQGDEVEPVGEAPEPPPVREVLRQLWGLALATVAVVAGPPRPRTLGGALADVRGASAADDLAGWAVGARVLDAVVQVRVGSSAARHEVWAGDAERSFAEVLELLAAGAEFARAHGPR